VGERSMTSRAPGTSARSRSLPDSVTAQSDLRLPVLEALNQTSFPSADQATLPRSYQPVDNVFARPERSRRRSCPPVSPPTKYSAMASESPPGETLMEPTAPFEL